MKKQRLIWLFKFVLIPLFCGVISLGMDFYDILLVIMVTGILLCIAIVELIIRFIAKKRLKLIDFQWIFIVLLCFFTMMAFKNIKLQIDKSSEKIERSNE